MRDQDRRGGTLRENGLLAVRLGLCITAGRTIQSGLAKIPASNNSMPLETM
jgi:hypothetical protein